MSLRLRFIAGISFLVSVLALAVPASAHHAPNEFATYRSQRVWVHCADANVSVRTTNAGALVWNTSSPAGSFVNDQAGCGDLSLPDQDAPIVGRTGAFTMSGTFTGNLRRLTVNLHDMGHAIMQPQNGGAFNVTVTLKVDDVTRVDAVTISPIPQSENSGVTDAVNFSIDGLDYTDEAGNGTTVRNLELQVVAPPGAFLVYDATEVPTGIMFNPSTLDPVAIQASPRG